MRQRRALRLLMTFALLGACCAVLKVIRVEDVVFALSSKDSASIRSALLARTAFSEPDAAAFAAKYGPSASPVLAEMMAEQMAANEPQSGAISRIAWCIGKIGDPKGADVLIRYIEAPLPAQLERCRYEDLVNTMVALGFLGTDKALEYLAALATEEYWENRANERGEAPKVLRDREGRTIWDEAKTRLMLRERAIWALGLSGKEKASEYLAAMKEKETSPQLLREIQVKTELCEERRR